MNIEVLADPEAVARRGADLVARASRRAIAERGLFVFAVSGGSTPRRLLELLAERDDIEWQRVHLFQVDERVAPDGDPDRNATMLRETLLTSEFRARFELAGVWQMPVTEPDLHDAAAVYAARMDEITGSPVVFDLVQLGLGSDGHTASLVPGDPILAITDVDVGLTEEYAGRRRMTLTWPVLDRATEQLWLVTGAGKRDAVVRYLEGDPSIPATLPTPARATLLVDDAAYTGARAVDFDDGEE